MEDNNLNNRWEKVNSQLDILPTVLNLFGVKYDENRYIGKDILANDYEGYAFFDDYSWLNNDVYYNDGNIIKIGNENVEEEKIYEINTQINKIIKKNDLTLKADYLKK